MQNQRKRKPKTNEQEKKEANKRRHKQTDTNKQSTNQANVQTSSTQAHRQPSKQNARTVSRPTIWDGRFQCRLNAHPLSDFATQLAFKTLCLRCFFCLSGCLYLLLHLFLPVVRTFFLSLRRRRRPATVTARTTTTTPPTTATTTAMRRTTTACRRRTTTATTTATDVLECPQDLASCQLL
jgi:hypothetical protein